MSDVPLKRCPVCEKEFPATTENFYKSGKNGSTTLRENCRKCYNKVNTAKKNARLLQLRLASTALSESAHTANGSLNLLAGTNGATIPESMIADNTEVKPRSGEQQEAAPQMSDVPYQSCRRCRRIFPKTEAFFSSATKQDGTLWIQKLCKLCESAQASSLEGMPRKERLKGTPTKCGSCGTETGNILGDVDENTKVQYGYLCARCHKMVSAFHANSARMRKVLIYIEKTRKKSV